MIATSPKLTMLRFKHNTKPIDIVAFIKVKLQSPIYLDILRGKYLEWRLKSLSQSAEQKTCVATSRHCKV